MDSKNLDTLYWALFAFYVLSFFLPVIDIRILKNSNTMYGFQAAYFGVMFYGLAVPAHLSAIGGLIHKLNMQNPTNPCQSWHNISIACSIIGTIPWFFIFVSEGLSIGYYLWLMTSIGMAVVYYNFRLAKSKEMILENDVVKNEGEDN